MDDEKGRNQRRERGQEFAQAELCENALLDRIDVDWNGEGGHGQSPQDQNDCHVLPVPYTTSASEEEEISISAGATLARLALDGAVMASLSLTGRERGTDRGDADAGAGWCTFLAFAIWT